MRLPGIETTAIGPPPLVRIYVPARSPMQSGRRRCKWVLEFEPSRPKIIEPLMGWTSSEDPLETISRLQFADRQSAIDFALRHGWPYVVHEPTAMREQGASSRTKIDGHQRGGTSAEYNRRELDRPDSRPRATGQRYGGAVMRSDIEIKRDVEDELRSDPDIDATDIGVAMKDGVVTLTGFVRSYRQRRGAEEDAKRVAGVIGVANDIEVRLPIIHHRPDPEIARNAVQAIQDELPFSWEKIKVLVEDRWVTLEGAVEWYYQRERAEEAVRRVRGVKGVSNNIQVRPQVAPMDIKRKIEAAFRRSAEIDASRITVEANGSEVVLRGSVRSWAERLEAEQAAWRAPGVAKVDNRIRIEA
jgi:osmotically-inducible protein OsmY